jgi:biopolymer transport protein ExbB
VNRGRATRPIRTATAIAGLGLALAAVTRAQEPAAGAGFPQPDSPFDAATASVERQLEASLDEIERLRAEVVAEKLPLSRRLSELEAELVRARQEAQAASRQLDARSLDLSTLNDEIRRYEEEASYLASLFGEYVRNLESHLHVAELQRYEEPLERAKLAPENQSLSRDEVFAAQVALLGVSLERLHEALGGTRFPGSAVGTDSRIAPGTYALFGPAALFLPDGAALAESAEQRLGSLEPTLVAFPRPEDALAAAGLVASGSGEFPVDPTLGDAHKILAAHEETFLEEFQSGGPVMYPIFAMAGLALLLALAKWLHLSQQRLPSRKGVAALLAAVGDGKVDEVRVLAREVRGPVGRMLVAGAENLAQPKELVEEAMFETVLTTRLRLQSFLSFIAICASSAPLLGLLGTVTGIIETFKMITVFGSGDVKSLSGGISEALITTKYGLIVAIPALLLHAFLARKARGISDRMEKTAVAFLNEVSRAEQGLRRARLDRPGAAPDPELVKAQVSEILNDLLVPLVREPVQGTRRTAGAAAQR